MLILMSNLTAHAEFGDARDAAGFNQITLEINQSYYLNVLYQIQRVSIANPKIADVRVLGATDLNIIAYDAGSTSLTIWTKDGDMIEYIVTVVPTDKGLAKAIENAINMPGVQVEKVGERILLRGTVKHQKEVERAKKIASMYIKSTGGGSGDSDNSNVNIISLLEMENPVQINLEAMVLDVSSANTSNFGFQYANASDISASDTGYSITFGTVGTFSGGQNYEQLSGKPFLNVDVQIQALVQKGLAKVLSRPNITTLSGEPAEIMIGGSIPIPVSDSDGAINVQWKDYGIKLHVEPELDRDNKIVSKVESEVSTLDYDHAVTSTAGTFPAMTKRTASAVINLESGMTMVIGGLLNSQDGKTVKKIPLLGDIPIIGEFFKHTSKTKDKRELVILIKPRIVSTNEPARMSKNTEEYYKENQKWANERSYVDINNQESVIENDDKLVAGANNEADNVLSDLAAADPNELSENLAVENTDLPEDTELATLESAEKTPMLTMEELAAMPESVESNNVKLPEESDQTVENESEPLAEEQNEAVTQDNTSKESSSNNENQDKVNDIMLQLADKLSEINSLIRQVADKNDTSNETTKSTAESEKNVKG